MTPAEMVAKKKAEKRKGRKPPYVRRVVFDCKLQAMLDNMRLTACDVANESGLEMSGVYKIVKGAGLSLATAFKIAKFFGKPIEEIWSLKEVEKGK